MEPSINYLAVFLAAVATTLVGFFWYSKLLFGKQWSRLMGYTDETLKEAQKGLGALYGVSFLLSLLTSYLLAHVAALSDNFYPYGTLQTAITSAFFMWLGFVMPVQFTGEVFGTKKWMLFAINTGYQLVSLIAAGAIIGLLS